MSPTQTTTIQVTASKPKIRHIKGNHYSVESRTRGGSIHHIDTYHLTCSCEAGRRGKRCWALAVALEFEGWRKREQAKSEQRQQQPTRALAAAATPPAPRAAETGMRALQSAFE